MTTLTWLVLDITGSPFLVGLVGFFAMVPFLFLGIFGGILSDRLDRRLLLAATPIANVAASFVMVWLLYTDKLEFWYAYAVVLVSGIGWALDMSSRRSLVLDIIGHAGVTNGIALDSVAMHISKMLGPAVAGALILLTGEQGAYIMLTSLYSASVGLILCVKMPSNIPSLTAQSKTRIVSNHTTFVMETRHVKRIFTELNEGFGYVFQNSILLAVVIITIFMNVLLFPYIQMIPVIARDILGVGPGLMGILMAADGLGALVGSIVIASNGNTKSHGSIFLFGSLLSLSSVLIFALSQWYMASVFVLIVLGFGSAGFGTMQSTIIMLAAKDDMRGRALGVLTLAIGAGPIGALAMGGTANVIGPSLAVAVYAVTGLVVIGCIALIMPSIRTDISLNHRQLKG